MTKVSRTHVRDEGEKLKLKEAERKKRLEEIKQRKMEVNESNVGERVQFD